MLLVFVMLLLSYWYYIDFIISHTELKACFPAGPASRNCSSSRSCQQDVQFQPELLSGQLHGSLKKRDGSGIAQSESKNEAEVNGQSTDVFTKSEYSQVPLLDRSASIMEDIVVT